MPFSLHVVAFTTAALLTACSTQPVVQFVQTPLAMPEPSDWPTVSEAELTCLPYDEFVTLMEEYLVGVSGRISWALYSKLKEKMCISDDVYNRIAARDDAKSFDMKRLVAAGCSTWADPVKCQSIYSPPD